MKPISIFYHALLSGGDPPANPDNCLRIFVEQMDTLNFTGLREAAKYIAVGISGTDENYMMARSIVPWNGMVFFHNKAGVGELPTMKHMQEWCSLNPGHAVLYFHTKGAIHNGSPPYEAWRRCMERVVLWKWRDCVTDLTDKGKDSAGAHWLTPAAYPFIGRTPYWGGNFWWATSDFINTLPPIDVTLSRYEAEVWIGRGRRYPKVRDYAPHFPMNRCST